MSPWLERVRIGINAVSRNIDFQAFKFRPLQTNRSNFTKLSRREVCASRTLLKVHFVEWGPVTVAQVAQFPQWTGCPSGLSPVHVTHWADQLTGPRPSSRSPAFPPRSLQLVLACRRTQNCRLNSLQTCQRMSQRAAYSWISLCSTVPACPCDAGPLGPTPCSHGWEVPEEAYRPPRGEQAC